MTENKAENNTSAGSASDHEIRGKSQTFHSVTIHVVTGYHDFSYNY